MRRLTIPLAAALVAAFLALSASAGAQDQQQIRAGLSAGGVDLSGLTVTDAAAKLDAALAPALNQDLVLGAAGRPWTLSMSAAKLRFDAVRTAKRALYAKAGVTSVPLALSHSHLAVKAFARFVGARVGHAARDARMRITLRHIFLSHSRPGTALDQAGAAKAIDAALDDPAAPRHVHVRLARTRPSTTANELRDRNGGTVITVDRSHFRLRLFKHLKFFKSYPVAVGMAGLDTPAGLYAIHDKQVNPAWHVPNDSWAGSLAGQTIPGGAPDNPLRARWLGIANGVGIHGTSEDWSIGSRASHGCIRMHVSDVIDLYPRVPVGTPVLID
ncbi:MAG TPA: L,D-transpeptidase [Solirubrobacteraceae bacterium]|nr:L,D-transpeptidase [Solirubrobacteraceae bacterium]